MFFNGQHYTGTITLNTPGYVQGVFCKSFVLAVSINASGELNNGGPVAGFQAGVLKMKYRPLTTHDGTAPVAGMTVSRDIAIFPTYNSLISLYGFNNNMPMTANDTESRQRIHGYRIDVYMGVGSATCPANYHNVMAIGACAVAQGTTCPASALQ
jgi:hypothetical protein